MSNRSLFACFFGVLVALALAGPAQVAHAQNTKDALPKTKEEIAAKEKEIADLDKKIRELKGQRDVTASEADIIAAQVEQLDGQLRKAQLELRATELTISKVQTERGDNEKTIEGLGTEIKQKRQQLEALLRSLYVQEQESVIRIFFSSLSFSEVLAQRAALSQLQEQTIKVVNEMKSQQADLEQKQQELAQQEQDLGQLQELLADQRNEIGYQQQEKNRFLQAKQNEQAQYENLIKEAQNARQEIEQQIFSLQSSGIEVSLNSAQDMANYAGKLTGVKPSLLMAVLKVESDVGNNIGSGKFPDDMQPASREPFLRITKKLGIDPYTAKIARRPASGKGWGGAIGPAQIMPATWEGIEPRLIQLTGKPTVNPYELADAFVATAIFLADRGATAPGGEREAVGRYIAGPNWQYYSWYIDKVMAVAAEYEKAG